jgi:hypothetical protein
MKTLLLLSGLVLAPAAYGDSAILIWGSGLDLCQAMVKASDDNLARFKEDHKGAPIEQINYADAVIPYMQYVAGVVQGYEQGTRQVMSSDFNSLFLNTVDYCRKNPGDKVATAVANSLANAKFGK